MKRVKGVNSAQAASAKELNSNTIETAVKAFFTAELALPIGEDPSAFKPGGLFKPKPTFVSPLQ